MKYVDKELHIEVRCMQTTDDPYDVGGAEWLDNLDYWLKHGWVESDYGYWLKHWKKPWVEIYAFEPGFDFAQAFVSEWMHANRISSVAFSFNKTIPA